MQRREFIGLVGCAAVAWPVAARAQQAAMPVVGYLGASSRETTERLVAAFLLSLKEAGFIEGQNVAIQPADTKGHQGGAVLAAVGWRAGQRPNFNNVPDAPSNGAPASAISAPII